MKTAVIYARYSSERQTEQSIEGQLRVCQDFAERNDILIVGTYIDRAMTGTNDNRKEFQQILRDSSKQAWELVLIYKLDRFSRNKYEMAMHKKTLRDNGIKLMSAMENIPDSPDGIILESLLEGMAEYYSAELSQKVRRGMNESRHKGNFTDGYVPYGYKIVDKKVVIIEEQADIVRLVYDRYAKGVFIKDIMAELNAMGITNARGNPFAKNTLHHMLQYEKYAGIYRYGGEVFDNIYPRIVSDEIFQIVHQKNEDNRYGDRSPDVVYLLRRKIKCGYCGRTVNGITGTSKTGKVNRYYYRSGVYGKKGCSKKGVQKEATEQIVLDAVLKAFNNPTTLSILADDILEANKQRMKNQSVLALLLKEKEQTETAIENMLIAIEKGVVTASTTKRLQTMEEKLGDLNAKILVEQSKERMNITKTEIISFIKKTLTQKPERVIGMLVKEIILYDDKIEIICNYTNGKGPDDSPRQDLLFYSDVIAMPYVDNITKSQTVPLKLEILV